MRRAAATLASIAGNVADAACGAPGVELVPRILAFAAANSLSVRAPCSCSVEMRSSAIATPLPVAPDRDIADVGGPAGSGCDFGGCAGRAAGRAASGGLARAAGVLAAAFLAVGVFAAVVLAADVLVVLVLVALVLDEALGLARAGRCLAVAVLCLPWVLLAVVFTRVLAFAFVRFRGRDLVRADFAGCFDSSSRTRFDSPSVLMDRALRMYPIPS